MANQVHHQAGTRIAHAPSDNTKPYIADVTADSLIVRYVIENEPVLRVYEWENLGAGVYVWLRANAWRRNYYDDGTYTVHQGSLLIESGTYTT